MCRLLNYFTFIGSFPDNQRNLSTSAGLRAGGESRLSVADVGHIRGGGDELRKV